MPTIEQKNRQQAADSSEIQVYESTSKGKTIPTEYVPFTEINNFYDSTAPAGEQGDPNKTGIVGRFTQKTLDYLFGGLGKLRTRFILGNTQEANDAGKISSTLLTKEENSPLQYFDDNNYYIGPNILSGEEVVARLYNLVERVRQWGLGTKTINNQQAGRIKISGTTKYTVWRTSGITIGDNEQNFWGTGFNILTNTQLEFGGSNADNRPINFTVELQRSTNADLSNAQTIRRIRRVVKEHNGAFFDFEDVEMNYRDHEQLPADTYYFQTVVYLNSPNEYGYGSELDIVFENSYINIQVMKTIIGY